MSLAIGRMTEIGRVGFGPARRVELRRSGYSTANETRLSARKSRKRGNLLAGLHGGIGIAIARRELIGLSSSLSCLLDGCKQFCHCCFCTIYFGSLFHSIAVSWPIMHG